MKEGRALQTWKTREYSEQFFGNKIDNSEITEKWNPVKQNEM
jgi:hypothetical protein